MARIPKIKLVCAECYKRLEGEAFIVPAVASKVKADYSESKKLVSEYSSLFVTNISPELPIFNYGLVMKMAKKQIDRLGLARMRQLLNAYLSSDDEFYKKNAYSITLFLADNTINRLNVFTSH